MQHIIFKTQDDYYKWLNKPEESCQETVDIALAYIAQLHNEINTCNELLKLKDVTIEQLEEYKFMYDDLCK